MLVSCFSSKCVCTIKIVVTQVTPLVLKKFSRELAEFPPHKRNYVEQYSVRLLSRLGAWADVFAFLGFDVVHAYLTVQQN